MKTSCCKDCQDRVPPTKETLGCRSYCEKWKEYEKEYKEILDKKTENYKKNEWKAYFNQKYIDNSKKYKRNDYGK